MTINWNIIIPLCTLIAGLIYQTLNYRQENLKLKIELEKYNDKKGPSLKKELSDLEDYIIYFLRSFMIYARMDRSNQVPVIDLEPFILNFSISNYDYLFNILSKEEIDFIRTTHTSMTFISAVTKGFFSSKDKKDLGIPRESYNEYIDSVMDKYLLSEKNREILISIAEKIDKNFDVTCYDKSLANNTAVLYDEAKTIYISLKSTSS